MRKTLIATVVALLTCVSSAWAVPPGMTVEWDTNMGKVTFKGDVHAGRGLACTECHTQVFPMQKHATEMTMAEINEGKFCGTCHNGERAFKTSDGANCMKCHQMGQ
jgi:c(7)-type cytochrome triheme protein